MIYLRRVHQSSTSAKAILRLCLRIVVMLTFPVVLAHAQTGKTDKNETKGQNEWQQAANTAGEESAWNAIQHSNEPARFEEFLLTDPSYEYAQKARDRLEELKPAAGLHEMTWRNVLFSGLGSDERMQAYWYSEFIKKFPKSPYARLAQERFIALKKKRVGDMPPDFNRSAIVMWRLFSSGQPVLKTPRP